MPHAGSRKRNSRISVFCFRKRRRQRGTICPSLARKNSQTKSPLRLSVTSGHTWHEASAGPDASFSFRPADRIRPDASVLQDGERSRRLISVPLAIAGSRFRLPNPRSRLPVLLHARKLPDQAASPLANPRAEGLCDQSSTLAAAGKGNPCPWSEVLIRSRARMRARTLS